MRYALKETRLGLRNSTTRIPFRYGASTLTRCPQAVLEVVIEVNGMAHRGWSGDCLPPGWFDKTRGRSYRDQIADMIGSINLARLAYEEDARNPVEFFESWIDAGRNARESAFHRGVNALLAGFGTSLMERAVMDAIARACGVGFSEAVRSGLYGIDPGAIHPELAGLVPADWLPPSPRDSVFVRHTIGLVDPLDDAEISEEDRVGDGLPQSLESHVERTGLCYFKIKLSADLEHDRGRLVEIAGRIERHRGPDYFVTLDGNEQFSNAEALLEMFELLRKEPRLQRLLENVVAVEQPLERAIAFDESQAEGIRRLSAWRPVIIDESDDSIGSYRRALEVGYRGVSSKNCKGPIKSILNAGLTWLRNDQGRNRDLIMTGEDLCSVGVIPVQADLCLVATLGLDHVERNGHHYHPGLSYLPEADQRAALAAHPDLYAAQGSIIGPLVREGRFAIGSLHAIGFGFAVEPDLEAYTPAEDWRFESLGLEE